jgi:ribonuclease VapC
LTHAAVLDASAMLAVVLREPGGRAVDDRGRHCFISVVNLAEVGGKMMKIGVAESEIASALVDLGVTPIEPDLETAAAVARLYLPTRRAGLSLGDRFCLALAKQMDLPALTGDRRWLVVADEVGVKVELFR